MLVDLISGMMIIGFDGYVFYIVQLFVGLVVDGGLLFDVEICIMIDLNVEFFVLLVFLIQFGYEFGDMVIGVNGLIFGIWFDDLVILIIVIFEKENMVLEEEWLLGWFFDYVFNVDIVNGVQFENICIIDIILLEFQFNGLIQIMGGVGCMDNFVFLLIDIMCILVVGIIVDFDIEVIFEVELFDIFDEMVCDF